MWMRAARWLVAAWIGSAMCAVGCSPAPATSRQTVRPRIPIGPDISVIHALDTRLEMRLIDRLQMDTVLRHRDIRVEMTGGGVTLTGEVRTHHERVRAAELIRAVPGIANVSNDLVVRP